MDTLLSIFQILAAVLGCMAALASILLYLRLQWPAPALWVLKLYISALSPLLALVGVLCAIVGLATGSLFVGLVGIFVMQAFFIHRFRVTRPPDESSNFERTFGTDWQSLIDREQQQHFLHKRTVLRLPAVESARMEQDIAFTTVAGTGRQLLCDLWQPPDGVTPSGVAFIYFHGAAWYMLDKDLSTRPFFGHLASEGHTIMDVAYRLVPETDMMGMIGDVKRAIVWMKEHPDAYGVNPESVVIGGGSSGAHLALVAAYTAHDDLFTPKELEGKDLSVRAVISLYGPTDLEAMYYHLNQHITTRDLPGKPRKPAPTKMPDWIIKKMGKEYHRLGFDKGFANAGAFAPMLGGHPDECPERYALYSPVKHVHADCPPTLLIHGEHDVMAPVKTTRNLFKLLEQEQVPAVMHILPQTEHAFDLILPKISPSAHNAIYDVERFIALMVIKKASNDNSYAANELELLQVNTA